MSQVLEKTLREWQHRFDEVIFAGDASRLVNEFYHPEAAFIGNGKVSFGRDEITATWTHIMLEAKGMKVETRHDSFIEVENGKRVFLEGTFWPVADPSKTSRFIIELVKSGDEYLVYRDYFEP
ncbi:hypothetical protein AAVH_25272 [Aphelenchoides avenae]|nr:hypothetical protein AAVH_25272 [Aphelenchus avenae]